MVETGRNGHFLGILWDNRHIISGYYEQWDLASTMILGYFGGVPENVGCASLNYIEMQYIL